MPNSGGGFKCPLALVLRPIKCAVQAFFKPLNGQKSDFPGVAVGATPATVVTQLL